MKLRSSPSFERGNNGVRSLLLRLGRPRIELSLQRANQRPFFERPRPKASWIGHSGHACPESANPCALPTCPACAVHPAWLAGRCAGAIYVAWQTIRLSARPAPRVARCGRSGLLRRPLATFRSRKRAAAVQPAVGGMFGIAPLQKLCGAGPICHRRGSRQVCPAHAGLPEVIVVAG